MTHSKEPEELGRQAPSGESPPSKPTKQDRRASLYEDTLSEKKRKSPWISIAWVMLFLVVIVGLVSTLLTNSSKERITELAEISRAEKENSPLAQKIREVREQISTDHAPAMTEESRPENDESETVEESIQDTPLPPSSRRPAKASQADPEAPSPEISPELPEAQDSGETPDTSSEADRPPDLAKVEPSPSAETTAEDSSSGPEDVPEEPARSEADLRAYQTLLKNSGAAEELVSGRLTTLSYRDWRVVQRTEKEVWIDLIAEWTTGASSEVHLIWAVSRNDGTVRALSDAARTLDGAN